MENVPIATECSSALKPRPRSFSARPRWRARTVATRSRVAGPAAVNHHCRIASATSLDAEAIRMGDQIGSVRQDARISSPWCRRVVFVMKGGSLQAGDKKRVSVFITGIRLPSRFSLNHGQRAGERSDANHRTRCSGVRCSLLSIPRTA